MLMYSDYHFLFEISTARISVRLQAMQSEGFDGYLQFILANARIWPLNKPQILFSYSSNLAIRSYSFIIGRVGTVHINSGADQSQLRRRPMLSNGRINTFPQQRRRPSCSVNDTRYHGNSLANTQ
jgi:hypothetical protein